MKEALPCLGILAILIVGGLLWSLLDFAARYDELQEQERREHADD